MATIVEAPELEIRPSNCFMPTVERPQPVDDESQIPYLCLRKLICRPYDELMSMGIRHRCLLIAKNNMVDYPYPANMEQVAWENVKTRKRSGNVDPEILSAILRRFLFKFG